MAPSSSPQASPAIGGRYAIQRKLGAGSIGTVYLALDTRAGRPVALKVLRPDHFSAGAVERFRREFGAIAALRHPQIAEAFDFGYTDGGLPYYTREYIEGTPCAAGPPAGAPPAEFLEPILDLLEALEYLHAHGILHLDIHPGNLIVARNSARGSVLIDFGLFRSGSGPRLTRALDSTQPFVPPPPEVLRGERLGPATDLFLAGRLLLHRLAGELAGEARLPREIPGWGARRTLELERISAKALAEDPARRFRSAGEFRGALERALGSSRRERGSGEPAAVTVGRERELERIERILRAAASGRCDLLCLTGPSGVGKSRLLEEARLRAQILGLDAVTARFFPRSGRTSPLLEALGANRAHPGRKGVVPAPAGWLEPLDAAHGGTPQERARRAAAAYFEEEARPSLLILDDLDRADAGSTRLARALLNETLARRARDARGRGLAIVAAAGRWPAAARTAMGRSEDSPALAVLGRRDFLLVRPLPPATARRLLTAVVASRSQTLRVPKDVISRSVAAAKGSPLLLRRIARALADEWVRAGAIPAGADIPDLPRDPVAAGLAPRRTGEGERAVLRALALLDRAATRQELARTIDRTPHAISGPLRRLELEELVAARGRGAARRFELNRPGAAEVLVRETPPEEARRLHRRLARFLAGQPRRGPREAEDLARHLLRGGRKPAGTREAFRAVRLLRGAGCLERAIALLEEVLAGEPDPRRKFYLLEELSSLLEEIGDHEKGVALLEPFQRQALRLLPAREGVRLRRRLGVHFHRAGRAEAAARILEEAARIADPTLDREDLIVIDSELAELHTLRGRLDEADAACRRGLERLTGLRRGDAFRGRMEVILRASRGHLELRRLRVAEAREDFRAALHLAKCFRMPAIRAVILNNLGIAESQLNRLAAARIAFREAEALFLAAGEKRSVIIIAGNLAVIAAKLGDREESRREIERAERLLRTAPAERLEFSVAYGRGVAAALLGDGEEVLDAMPAALALGRRLGDAHLTRYGEVYLAEARMACGRLEEARHGLTALAQEAERDGPPILARMAQSRLFLLARLLGQEGAAERSRRRLQGLPRGDMEYLEAWCDLFEGFALALPARSPQKHPPAGTRPPGSEPPETLRSAKRILEDARLAFRRLRLLSGERAARLALLFEALSRKDAGSVETEVRSLRADETRSGPVRHRFLEVARPLLLAEAHFFLGHPQEAQDLLSEASGAIIGSAFLELDWRIEFLRTRLALRSGDATAARAHFHRALHTRDLLGRLVSGPGRNRFLAQPRFRDLEALAPRLERSPRLASSSVPDDGGSYQGMVGRSRQMVEVFRTIDRLREQELPILITGEIGTGKELVARALHRTSPRGSGPFLALHAGSLPVELFEAELFGHEKGAFSGAEEERPGLLESLAGGTLLLDEVTALPLAAQAKLLRVLATGRARRLGATGERAVDVRFLASAGVDLAERVRTGEFREDLLNRLRVVEIRLPPLRERQGDHAVLAQRFLEIHARRLGRPVPTLAPSAIAALEAQTWRGNVRELETVVLRALSSLSPFLSLGAKELQPLLSREGEEGTGAEETILRRILTEDLPLGELRRRFERLYLLRLFRRVSGDPKKMMEILGVTQSYLYGRLKKLGIDVRTLRKELEL